MVIAHAFHPESDPYIGISTFFFCNFSQVRYETYYCARALLRQVEVEVAVF